MDPRAVPGEQFFNHIRELGIARPDEGRWVAGVCASLARRWGVDPLLVRGLTIVVSLVSGFGLGLYGLLWLFLPHPDGRIHAQQVLRGVVTAGFVGSMLFLLVGLPASGAAWGSQGTLRPSSSLGFLALVGFGAWWWVNRHSPRQPAQPNSDVAFRGEPPVPPEYGTPPQPPVVAATPRRVDVRRPRRALTLATYGTAFITFAVVEGWDRWVGRLPHAELVAGAAALSVVALGILLAGLSGHRAGGLIPLALFLAVLSSNSAAWRGGWPSTDTRTAIWAPTSATAATTGYQLGAGRAILDLTTTGPLAGATSTSPTTIPASIGVGELVIIVPKSVSSRVDASVGLGAVTDRTNGNTDDHGGAGVEETIQNGTSPVLIITADVGLGHIEVVPQGMEVSR
jgi:phage shock protein PspC (stress-responsive transcriptional regulator)